MFLPHSSWFVAQFEMGRSSVRGSDNLRVNQNIGSYYEFIPSLPARKDERGNKHSQCFRFLFPIDRDIDDEK